MICLNTTFLIDLWRHRDDAAHPARKLLEEHSTEVFAVPVIAAGEFLEGAAHVSKTRLNEAVIFLRIFQPGEIDFETAITMRKSSPIYAVAGDLKASPKQISGLLPGRYRIKPVWLLRNGSISATSKTSV